MKTYILFWSPEGRPIALVDASNATIALSHATKPYAQYKGEIYVEELTDKWRNLASIRRIPHIKP